MQSRKTCLNCLNFFHWVLKKRIFPFYVPARVFFWKGEEKMSVKQLCKIAIMACIEQVVFSSFTEILYLECITLTIVSFALVFKREEAFLAAIVFGFLNMFVKQGVTPWSIMYLLVYPTYTLFVSCLKRFLIKHRGLIAPVCGFLSFLTGQLLQLPFMLVSKKITMLYIIAGLKTSLIQGAISCIACWLLFPKIYQVLTRIERNKK